MLGGKIKILVGREFEKERIEKLFKENEPQIITIYGRRRVGKTTLIEKTLSQKRVLKIEGLENQSSGQQIEHAKETLLEYVKDIQLTDKKINSWKKFFTVASEYIGTHFDIIYLEELQWLANYRTELISELKYVWDNYFSKKDKFLLVLCGSSPSFIVKKVIHSKALYNRSQHEMLLKPFTLNETWEFLGKKNDLLRVFEAYLLIGGVPEYLKRLKKESSFTLAIAKESFLPDSFFVNEYEKIFTSSLSKNPLYKKIIELISKKGKINRQDIEKNLKVKSGGGLTDIIRDLELSGFIKAEETVLESGNKNRRFYISDPYVLFYNRFIKQNLKSISKGEYIKSPLSIMTKDQLNSLLGYNFEHFCMENSELIAEILGFGSVKYLSGSYYNFNDGYPFQLDLLFEREDKVITVCELKYGEQKIGLAECKKFQDRLDKLIYLIKNERKYSKYKRFRIDTALVSLSDNEDVVTLETKTGGYFNRIIRIKEFEKVFK